MAKKRKKPKKHKPGRERRYPWPMPVASGGVWITRPGALTWPIIHAYVPDQMAWNASGMGTAGVVREQPDGRWTYAFFWLSVPEDGLVNMFGKSDSNADELDRLFRSLRDQMPPYEEGPVERVAEYVWGAYALGNACGDLWPPEVGDNLSLVPQPPGNQSQWLDRFIGPHGLTPRGLIKVIRENPQPDDIPEGKEIVIFTSMRFRIDDRQAVVARLQEQEPEFMLTEQDDESDSFAWTRKYPQGHWSPLALLGGRQSLGDIRVGPDRLVAETQTLSMACWLVVVLKGVLGGQLTLEDTTWTGIQDIVKAGRRT